MQPGVKHVQGKLAGLEWWSVQAAKPHTEPFLGQIAPFSGTQSPNRIRSDANGPHTIAKLGQTVAQPARPGVGHDP